MISRERREQIRKEAEMWLIELYNDYSSFREFIDLYSEDDCSNMEHWSSFKYALYEDNYDVRATNGSFRSVLIIDNFDWVIKFNLDTYIDYCEHELQIYEDAILDKIDHYFAPCMYGGEFHGIRFYLMAKAVAEEEEIIEEMSINLYNNDKEYVQYSAENERMTEDDMEVIINIFGTHYSHDEVFRLLDFCSFRNIFDIHEGNVGYLDLNPVIIDYASC